MHVHVCVHARRSHAWVEDSALFGVARTLPVLSEQAWWDWPEGLRFRQEKAMAEFRCGWIAAKVKMQLLQERGAGNAQWEKKVAAVIKARAKL